jgi:hypothetical protein
VSRPRSSPWIVVVIPTVIDASNSGGEMRTAYFLGVTQALAVGPLIGFSQASQLRLYTKRWAWWILANLVSWLIVQLAFYLLSLAIDGFDFAHGKGTPAEAYITLIVAAPLSARWMLWVLAPDALTTQ